MVAKMANDLLVVAKILFCDGILRWVAHIGSFDISMVHELWALVDFWYVRIT